MALGFPGRFRIKQWFLMPAVCRLRMAVGTNFKDSLRINSPNPGSNFWQIFSVASGVISLGAGPVPPVVTIKQAPASSIRIISCINKSSSSGKTA